MKEFKICKLSLAVFLILFTAVAFSACGEECSHTSMSEVVVEPSCEKQGYDFAILKAGELFKNGDESLTEYPSPVYEMDYADAKRAGLDVGVYFYSNALSVEAAKKEAEYLLTLLDGKTFEYPIFFDIEFKGENDEKYNLSKKDLTDICIEFISTLQENGYYAALYTNNDFLKNYLQESKVTTLFDIWYSRPAYDEATGTVCTEWSWQEKFGKQMNMWQFSHTGRIVDSESNTILEKVDLNYAYKDYPSLIKSLGYNGFKKVQSTTNDLDGKLNSGNAN